MRKRLLTAALTLALLSAPALALTLSEARQRDEWGDAERLSRAAASG